MVLTPSSKINTNQSPVLGKPPRAGAVNKDKQRVSFSPTRSPRNGGRRRRSSSHFTKKNKKGKSLVDNRDIEESDDESDIEFTLNGVNDIDGGSDKHTIGGNNTTPTKKKKKPDKQQRRRRRSSARFLRLSSGGNDDANTNNGSPNSKNGDDENYTSSEHLGEIYRQAIRMNAENKINAGNSWGLKLIENMDKFIVEGNNGDGGDVSPRDNEDNARSELKAARKMKSKDEKGRVNFTKASCTLDASVKIYSYRVDDVHLSSYRVLANLNRTDTKGNKDDDGLENGGVDLDEGGEKTVSKRRAGPKGPIETLESNKGTFILLLFGFMLCCGFISANSLSLTDILYLHPTHLHLHTHSQHQYVQVGLSL